jgi:hypothetical protein
MSEDFESLLNDIIADVMPLRTTEIHCPDELFTQATHPMISNYDVGLKKIPGGYRMSIPCEGDFGSISERSVSGYKNAPTFSDDQAVKIRHELVFLSSHGDTDVFLNDRALSHIFKSVPPKTDCSPDLAIADEDGVLIIEFTTVEACQEHIVQAACLAKRRTYLGTLRERLKPGKTCAYIYISVGSNHACSNYAMSNEHATDLCSRWAFASKVEHGLEALGVIQKHKTAMSEELKKMKAFLLDLAEKGTIFPPLKNLIPDELDSFDCKAELENIQKDVTNPPEWNGFSESVSWSDLIDKNKLGNPTLHQRKVVYMPGVTLRRKAKTDRPPNPSSSRETCMARIWYYGLNQLHCGNMSAHTAEEIIDRADKNISAEEVREKEGRAFQHGYKFSVPLSEEETIYLAARGISAKRLKEEQKVVDNREMSKQHLDYKCDNNDIKAFINNKDFSRSGSQNHLSHTVRELILSNFDDDSDSFDVAEDILNEFGSSTMMHHSNLVNGIAAELSLALKQHTERGEFLVRELKEYNLYLIIFCPWGDEMVFYSYAYKPEDVLENIETGKIFPTTKSMYGLNISEFFSINRARLETMVTMNSIAFSILGLKRRQNVLGMSDTACGAFANASYLVALENNSKTEEAITISRYIYMESATKMVGLIPCPGKMREKFNPFPRSRLELFFIWALEKAIIRLENIQPSRDTTNKKKNDTWNDLPEFLTWENCPSFRCLVDYFYLGYYTNKMYKKEKNTQFSLIKKIVDLEDKLLAVKAFRGHEIGQSEVTGLKVHEYNRAIVKYSATVLLAVLSARRGLKVDKTKAYIEESFLKKLVGLNIEDMCTLKSSNQLYPEVDDPNTKKPPRSKAAIEILKMVQGSGVKSTNPIHHLEYCMLRCEAQGGLMVDLTPKDQHGGSREIYILAAEGRLVQFFLENVSRAICDLFIEETMTHPDSKTSIPAAHKNREKNWAGSDVEVRHYFSSNDAKNWNNTHHVSKFYLMLKELTPEGYHPLLKRSLNLFLNKRICIPDHVMSLMDRCEELWPVLSGDIRDFLEKVSLGQSCARKGHRLLHIESGMMQGILHFTSSLFHLCKLFFLKYTLNDSFLPYKVRESQKDSEILMKSKMHFDFMVGSDDSAEILQIMAPSGYLGHKLSNSFARFSMAMSKNLSELMGIYLSIKSAVGNCDVLEYNSEWWIRNTMVLPVVKFLASAYHILPSETFLDKYQAADGLASEILAKSGSSRLSFIVSLGQALTHYRLLGSSVNITFLEYSRRLLTIRDPNAGYFLLEIPRQSGWTGFRYRYYKHLMKPANSLVRKKLKTYFGVDRETYLTSAGSIAYGMGIFMGDAKQAQNFINRIMSLPLLYNWREGLRADPLVLLKHQNNLTFEECMIRIGSRLSKPSVASAIANTNATVKAAGSMVYILNEPIMRVGFKKMFEAGSTSRKIKKISILHYLLPENFPEGDDLTEDELLTLFPLLESYRFFEREIESDVREGQEEFYLDETPASKTKFSVFSNTLSKQHPPLALILKAFWLKESVKMSGFEREREFRFYKSVYPWLERTFEETCLKAIGEDSYFESAEELVNHIMKQPPTDREIIVNVKKPHTDLPYLKTRWAIGETIDTGVVLNMGAPRDVEIHTDKENVVLALTIAKSIFHTEDKAILFDNVMTRTTGVTDSLSFMRAWQRRDSENQLLWLSKTLKPMEMLWRVVKEKKVHPGTTLALVDGLWFRFTHVEGDILHICGELDLAESKSTIPEICLLRAIKMTGLRCNFRSKEYRGLVTFNGLTVSDTVLGIPYDFSPDDIHQDLLRLFSSKVKIIFHKEEVRCALITDLRWASPYSENYYPEKPELDFVLNPHDFVMRKLTNRQRDLMFGYLAVLLHDLKILTPEKDGRVWNDKFGDSRLLVQTPVLNRRGAYTYDAQGNRIRQPTWYSVLSWATRWRRSSDEERRLRICFLVMALATMSGENLSVDEGTVIIQSISYLNKYKDTAWQESEGTKMFNYCKNLGATCMDVLGVDVTDVGTHFGPVDEEQAILKKRIKEMADLWFSEPIRIDPAQAKELVASLNIAQHPTSDLEMAEDELIYATQWSDLIGLGNDFDLTVDALTKRDREGIYESREAPTKSAKLYKRFLLDTFSYWENETPKFSDLVRAGVSATDAKKEHSPAWFAWFGASWVNVKRAKLEERKTKKVINLPSLSVDPELLDRVEDAIDRSEYSHEPVGRDTSDEESEEDPDIIIIG